MLSRTTAATLAKMQIIDTMSNALPAGVSASKMTVCARSRREEWGSLLDIVRASYAHKDQPGELMSRAYPRRQARAAVACASAESSGAECRRLAPPRP